MPFISSLHDGAALHYRDWGAGPTCVFVHAWGLNSQMWTRQLADFAGRGFRCIAFDRRGHGRSDLATDGYDLDTLALDFHSILERAHLRDVTVVAHSMGAAEAVRALSLFGADRVAALVLSAPTTPMIARSDDNPEGADPAVLAAVAELVGRDVGAFLASSSDGYFGDAPIDPVAWDWTRNTIFGTDPHVLAATQRAFTTADLRADVGAIDVPALVVQGDRDLSAPLERTGRITAELLPRGSLHVIAGGGHGIYYAHAPVYNDVIASFARDRAHAGVGGE